MKILILGSNGMAGHMIVKYLKMKNYELKTAAKSNSDYYLNVEDFESVKKLSLNLEQFDFVINCIGLLVQDSIARPDRAIIINAWFPKWLEYILKDTKTKIIHLSTDCVFDGKTGWYYEDDRHTETNMYGRSKSLGEIDNLKDVTFRMSIIGPEIKSNGTGLFSFVQHNTTRKIQGWTNAFWNGLTTLQLAKCIEKYINNPNHFGIYHLVNNNISIDKYNLICLINEIFSFKNEIVQTEGPKSVNKILFNSSSIDYEIPNYESQLNQLLQFYYS